MPSDDELAVRLEGVSKRYFLNPKRPWRLRDAIVRPKRLFRQIVPREPFWALRDITLHVRRGETLGIIGSNGSGKSTLLRVMVGLSPPTKGTVSINGRYAALLDLGAGFHPQATGRENAYLNALFMGLSKEEAKEKLPEIIEFSGLRKFADQPVRTYSSGMNLRLGFSVAVHVQPEILLIDELLAVGDAAFQEKCFDHFNRLKERSTTIVLVTHNTTILGDFADRAVLIDKGAIVADGQPDDVVNEYLTQKIEQSPAVRRRFERALAQQWGVEPPGESGDGPSRVGQGPAALTQRSSVDE